MRKKITAFQNKNRDIDYSRAWSEPKKLNKPSDFDVVFVFCIVGSDFKLQSTCFLHFVPVTIALSSLFNSFPFVMNLLLDTVLFLIHQRFLRLYAFSLIWVYRDLIFSLEYGHTMALRLMNDSIQNFKWSNLRFYLNRTKIIYFDTSIQQLLLQHLYFLTIIWIFINFDINTILNDIWFDLYRCLNLGSFIQQLFQSIPLRSFYHSLLSLFLALRLLR